MDMASGRKQKKILIIDDDRFNQKLLAMNLERKGHATLTALDGQEGYDMAVRERPDLIVMDLMMPKLDGFEATQLLKSNPGTRHIPVVALSAKVLPEDPEAFAEMGFVAYCRKPFRLTDLDRLIEEHLGAAPNHPA